MLVGFHAGDDAGDLAFRVDQESRAFDSHVLASVHALLFEHVELLRRLFIDVGQQRVGQAVFVFEFLLSRRLVGRDTKHNCAGFLDLLECVAEPARFERSTRRVGLGIEKQYYALTAVVFERDVLALFIGKSNLRGFIIKLHALYSLF
jgi:hypothetical protein